MARVISVAMTFVDSFSEPSKKTIANLNKMGQASVRAGRQIQKAGKTITNAGTGLTKSVTAPIAGVGIAAVKTAADFESAMSNVKAITKSSGKEMQKLTDHAQYLGKKTAWSAQEVAKAMQYTGMAGWKAKDNIAGLEGILNTASATGTDLALTSDIMTDAISAFGDKAKDSTMYANVMTSACTNANVSVETLGESYKYCASVAGTMKYSVQDVTASLAAMGNQGIKGSSAGTAMRTAMTNMAAPTDAAAKAMKELNISILDQNGNMKSWNDVVANCRQGFSGLTEAQQASYAKTIFGKSAMSGMLAVLNTSQKEYDNLSGAIKNSGGAAKAAADTQLDNLNGQITLLKSAAEGAAISFGNKMLPTLKKAVGVVQGFADKINGLSESQINLIIRIAKLVAVIGPMIMIFGKIVTTVGKVKMAFGGVMKTVASFGSITKLLTSPAAIVIAVIAAIALAAFLIIKNWEKIKPVVEKVMSAIKPAVDKARQAIQTAIAACIPVFKKIASVVKQVIPIIGKALVKAFLFVVGAVKQCMPYIKRIAKAIGGTLVFAVKKIAPVVKKVATIFTTVFGTVVKVVKRVVKSLSPAFKTIGKIITVVMKAAGSNIKTAFGVICNVIEGATKTIKDLISGITKIFSGVLDFITGIFTGNWKKAWEGIKQIFSGVFSSFTAIVKAPLNGIIGLINGAIEGFNKIKIPDWVPKVGGKGINIPKIPMLAKGTTNWKGGIVQHSERGGEIIDLPKGSRVYPHDASLKMARKEGENRAKGSAKKIEVHFHIKKLVVRNDGDIEKIADRFARDLEKIALNTP